MGKQQSELTHFDAGGNAIMVDVGGKAATLRTASACGTIAVGESAYAAIANGTAKKGDVLGVARIAGIMAAKKTSELIPLCHPLAITHCEVNFTLYPDSYEVKAVCTAETTGQTGVEMEALTGVSTALLTIYDMCKALGKGMELKQIYLAEKKGGKSGDYINENH